MVTIYFDKQVFSHLRNAKQEKHVRLLEKILSHKSEFIFLYSNALLFDLQQDKTDTKYAELEFIHSIVDNNYLTFDQCNENDIPNIMVFNESPCIAFDKTIKLGDFSWLEDFDFSKLTKEQNNCIRNVVDIITKEQAGLLSPDWLINREPINDESPIVDKHEVISVIKFIASVFYGNKESYKLLRDNAINAYMQLKSLTKQPYNTNIQQESSPLDLSFVETLRNSLVQTGLSLSNKAIIYNTAYMLLDLTGECKESSNKVRYLNLQIDSIHSFFGSFCDCIVSDDEGLRDKSRILYNLFGIETKIYSIDEFIEAFDKSIENNRKTINEYFRQIIYDYKSKQIIRTHEGDQYTVTHLRTSNQHFGYFTKMAEFRNEDDTVLMLYKGKDLNQMLLVKEVEILVNRITRNFNETGASFPLFNHDAELPLIQSDNWERILIIDDVDFCLTKFKECPVLCMTIRLKQPVLLEHSA